MYGHKCWLRPSINLSSVIASLEFVSSPRLFQQHSHNQRGHCTVCLTTMHCVNPKIQDSDGEIPQPEVWLIYTIFCIGRVVLDGQPTTVLLKHPIIIDYCGLYDVGLWIPLNWLGTGEFLGVLAIHTFFLCRQHRTHHKGSKFYFPSDKRDTLGVPSPFRVRKPLTSTKSEPVNTDIRVKHASRCTTEDSKP